MGTAIVVTSGKGGTGKTSITSGVAVSMAQLGRLVLCIDMDIGLRNLDIPLGLSDKALMDFSDVALGICPLVRATVTNHDIPALSLLTAPLVLPSTVTIKQIRKLVSDACNLYDYVFLDCPAGLGLGFEFATCAADRALVVATYDASSLRNAERIVASLQHISQVHLVMNRIQPKLLRRLHTTIDAAMDTTGLPLIGVVPEDTDVALSANLGKPLACITGRQDAAAACRNIAKRLDGQSVPILRIR